MDGAPASGVTVRDLGLAAHRSIRVGVAVREDARHPGDVDIFGRGFGDHDRDVILRLVRA